MSRGTPNIGPNCQLRPSGRSKRVVGGKEVSDKEHPWAVNFLYNGTKVLIAALFILAPNININILYLHKQYFNKQYTIFLLSIFGKNHGTFQARSWHLILSGSILKEELVISTHLPHRDKFLYQSKVICNRSKLYRKWYSAGRRLIIFFSLNFRRKKHFLNLNSIQKRFKIILYSFQF